MGKESRESKGLGMWTALRKHWYMCAIYIVFSYALTQIIIEGSKRIAFAADALFAGNGIDLKELLAPFILLVFLGTIAAFVKSLSKNAFSINMQTDIRNMLIEKLVKLPYSFLDKEGSGTLMNKVISDMYQIEALFVEMLPEGIIGGVTIIAVCISIFFIDVRLFVATIILYPPLLWLAGALTKKLTKVGVKRRNLYDELENVALDAYQGIAVGKSFNLYEVQKKRIFGVIDGILSNEYIRTKISAAAFTFGNIIKWIPTIVCYIFSLYEVWENNMTVGEFMAYIMLLDRLTFPLGSIPNYIATARESMVSVRRLQMILNEPEEPSGSIILEADDENCENYPVIELKNVHFAYEGDGKEVLSGFNLSVNAGENIAFVGSSGSGKSTLIKILCGFYRINSGEYRIYGHNYDEWNVEYLRKHIALVSQNVFLFPGTIAENVAYGRDGASMEEIVQACKNANIHDFIMQLPQGYDTSAGERGARLSGGQKQRISIARAFLKNAPILLLDEPTSAVDTRNEHIIQEAISRISEGRTVITIAHRLSTIINADTIYVMDKGNIVEFGTHKELISKKGAYSSLYEKETNPDSGYLKMGGREYGV